MRQRGLPAGGGFRGGEGGVDDDVVLIVPGFLVEGATTGDEPESGVVDGAIDGFGGEEVFG